MISFSLTDSEDAVSYEMYNAPFTDSEVATGQESVTTLSGDVYVDFVYTKRTWTREFSYMKESDYLRLKAFYDRQKTTLQFPLLSIPEFGIENVPVYLKISDRKTINSCGAVVDVKLTMRETVQQ